MRIRRRYRAGVQLGVRSSRQEAGEAAVKADNFITITFKVKN